MYIPWSKHDTEVFYHPGMGENKTPLNTEDETLTNVLGVIIAEETVDVYR